MSFTAQQVHDHIDELVIESRNLDTRFKTLDSTDAFGTSSLVFVAELPEDTDVIRATSLKPAVLVTTQEIADVVTDESFAVIVVKNVRLALALCKQRFADYDKTDSEWPSIHPSAVIHETARIGRGVRIGPNSVIGKDAELGENVQVRANCVVEHDAFIGADSVLHNMVNIGYECVIGERVIIRPGAIIGNEGFGFAQDENHQYHRIPHTGIVHISDDVQIGSNSNIDRATYGVTRIARGVKIDALCHIAHNVRVDEDALFVAQCGVAGSSNIGKRVVLSGQTGVLDHKTIVDDAVLVHRCGVTADVLEPGMWAGTPPKPFRDYVKDVNLAKKVLRLERDVKTLKTG